MFSRRAQAGPCPSPQGKWCFWCFTHRFSPLLSAIASTRNTKKTPETPETKQKTPKTLETPLIKSNGLANLHIFHRFSPKNTTSPQNTIFFHSHHWVDLRKWCVFGVLWWFWCVFVSPKSTGKHHIQSKMVYFRGFMVDYRHLCNRTFSKPFRPRNSLKRTITLFPRRVKRARVYRHGGTVKGQPHVDGPLLVESDYTQRRQIQ